MALFYIFNGSAKNYLSSSFIEMRAIRGLSSYKKENSECFTPFFNINFGNFFLHI